jgi:hypothetical protein
MMIHHQAGPPESGPSSIWYDSNWKKPGILDSEHRDARSR